MIRVTAGISDEQHGHEPSLLDAEARTWQLRRRQRADRGAPQIRELGELCQHRRGVGRARGSILGEHSRHQLVERSGHLGAELAHVRRLVDQDLGQDRGGMTPGERLLSGEALEEDTAEREHVRPRVDVALSARVLGGHVAQRAHAEARDGDVMGVRPAAGDAEVQDLGARRLAADQEQVAGFDVAVDDASLVRRRQTVSHPAGEGHSLGQRERLASEAARERLAVEPLHDQVGFLRRGATVRHVADNRRMVQLGEQRALELQPLDVAVGQRLQHLDRDLATGEGVGGSVDSAHAADARQLIQAEALGDEGGNPHETMIQSSSEALEADRCRPPHPEPGRGSRPPGTSAARGRTTRASSRPRGRRNERSLSRLQ